MVRAVSIWLGWNDQSTDVGDSMNVQDEVRREAENTGELVHKNLMEIMDLQGEIHALLRDDHPMGPVSDSAALSIGW
jgi:hypothetical protein